MVLRSTRGRGATGTFRDNARFSVSNPAQSRNVRVGVRLAPPVRAVSEKLPFQREGKGTFAETPLPLVDKGEVWPHFFLIDEEAGQRSSQPSNTAPRTVESTPATTVPATP